MLIGDIEVKIPVIQGGMGVGVSLSGLAGAVAREGAMGVISTAQIGFMEEDFGKNPIEANLRAIKRHIKHAKEISNNGVIGVNIMTVTRDYEKYVETAIEAGADIIISGAGLPVDLPRYVRDSKIKIAPIVSSLKSASVIMKLWQRKYDRRPDMVIIEGPLAGGHLGFAKDSIMSAVKNYDEEIKKIVAYVKEIANIPVIAAGGIFDRLDVRHYMSLGVDGIQAATRFVTTRECDASDRYKQAYIDASESDICIVNSPVGMPGRAINNEFVRSIKERPKKCYQCITTCDYKNMPYCITDALINAVKGNLEKGLIFCGANAYRCDKIESVKDVVADLTPMI